MKLCWQSHVVARNVLGIPRPAVLKFIRLVFSYISILPVHIAAYVTHTVNPDLNATQWCHYRAFILL